MGSKGTILIVEDLLDEKIGKFKQILDIEGFKTIVSETYKDAKEKIEKLINSNELTGVILDFSFPVDDIDKSVVINDIPCGVQLLKDFSFKMSLKSIPVVINTTGDNEYKKQYLASINTESIPMYDVDCALTSLTQPTPEMVKQILKLFNDRYEKRKLESSIKRDNSNLRTGRSVVSANGKIYYSRYDGD